MIKLLVVLFEMRALYAIDALGTEHFLGPATNPTICTKAAQAAKLDRPKGIKATLGPPPWRFECRVEDRFKPGWDKVK